MNLNNSLEFYMRVDKLHQTPLRGNLTTHKRKKRENEGNMKKLGEEPMDELQAVTLAQVDDSHVQRFGQSQSLGLK